MSEKIGQLKLKSLDGKYNNTDVWKENGVTEQMEYAILTNEIYKSWSGMTSKEYKDFKGFRDNLDNIEFVLTDLSEEATKRIAAKKKPQGLEENIKIAHKGGNIAKVARNQLEEELNESVVTKDNRLSYKFVKEKCLIETKNND